MNNVLELKGKRFVQARRNGNGGGIAMNGRIEVTTGHLLRLQSQLKQIKEFWDKETKPFEGILVSVYYNKIVAKSNRIAGLFKGTDSNDSIVGAKFNKDKSNHIITYFLDENDLIKSIELISNTLNILSEKFSGSINKNIFEDKNIVNPKMFKDLSMSMSTFKQVIADISYIGSFVIELPTIDIKQSIITLYDVKKDTKLLFENLGIDILSTRILDNQTVYLDEKQVELLFEKAPYLVSMATVDLSSLSPEDFIKEHQTKMVTIPSPTIEPTIGVIDTLFDETVYFSEWVEYHEMVSKDIPKIPKDYNHGTAVSSIIVDGAKLNPWLDDGCGRFKVRHFGVAVGAKFSSFSIIKQIKSIIANNSDIKVWNISLGSNQEINDNFISAEAATLDKIQFENNVIFVVAGTNKPSADIVKIGSPADSINSIVVNSVSKNGLSTKYARKGLVLSFFAKPDVSYYGGSEEEYIRVCEPLGTASVAGTSYAAPWIARKLSYLIDVLGLNREVAKAMIIDAARGWDEKPTPEEVALYGHGVVPIHINDIIQTKDDEIKFVVSDVSEKWNTYNYHFPVPLKDNKYPYIAKATMCYFPLCDRSQGVDYTNTEFNLHFGRIGNDNKIKDIKGDKQNIEDTSEEERNYLLEGEARKLFRKWDNVKYIAESATKKMIPKDSYRNKNWGMEVKTNNRLDPKDGTGVRFGVVVTLKEMNGVNRIDEFIRNCTLNGWLVNIIDVDNRIDIHQKVNEEIEFE
ncbi:serine protease [Fusobacterium necrophorum subsp. funduliforme]|uniref:Peptidase, S8/S53 family n=3 Tax=Fusobacterium necrophorum TaxID=859 RepID=A0AAN3VUH4_9FUSO|nr:S8 family peptidase [Fusobacterium necrophorum]EJU15679.1 peptidase, S8/S53 family [Fusobacterium necrophorum subsp. funduliforme Fnf 1007]KYM37867.1 serine protease [Fusobacterium necrophorum subsp. funduliforme]KYM38764.1 serine protease [Fusobacterium necrophorum subsp. funduliforme]KYM40724.1 serine protease [Fusobacterium necrophorum subsp. funduliforme]KYM49113.1 serine protease [Fusobacterium necrophorum subsp. funduliforme]